MICARLKMPLAPFTLDVDLVLKKSITALFGPSGSGKTSLLEAIAGLKKELNGKITIDDRDVFSSEAKLFLAPEKRFLGYVPQELLLFPHLNVRRNILYGAGNNKDSRITLESVAEALEISELLDRDPRNISGGERQRVALARALMTHPKLLLLDEPVAALDRGLKKRILPYLRRVRDAFHIPMIYVTHDIADVLTLCEEVVVLEKGRAVSQGAPREILKTRPVIERLLAGPIENVLEGIVFSQEKEKGVTQVKINDTLILSTPYHDSSVGSAAFLGVPAEDILLSLQPITEISARNILPGRIESIEIFEGVVVLRIFAEAFFLVRLTRGATDHLHLKEGQSVYLVIKSHSIHWLY